MVLWCMYKESMKPVIEKQEEKMFIRKAEEKDIPRILELLGQVLQIHADIRPDIFIPGTTKYTFCVLLREWNITSFFL